MVRPQVWMALGAIALLASCGSALPLPQAETSAAALSATGASAPLTYDDYSTLLQTYVDSSGVWNFRKHTVMGQPLTLDAIEHDILRQDFVEPRIHAALVCAALSCPPLRQEPYTGAALDQQLDDQVQQWLDGPHGLAIDQAANQVAISAIFDWFGDDWKPQYATDDGFTGSDKQRATLNFISQYLSSDDQAHLKAGSYQLTYLDYDWSLNRQ